MKKTAPLLLAILVSFLVNSCQSLDLGSLLREPLVSFRSVDFGGINFNGVDMIARVDVENPNPFEIPFPDIDWELSINSASFSKGTLGEDTKLKGGQSTLVDVPFSVSYAGLYDTFTSLFNTKEAAYRVDLGVRFPLPLLDQKTYHLDFSGVLPLLQIPSVKAGDFKIAKIDFTGVELDYGFTVENPNVFAVPFPDVDWEYEVNGQPLVKSSLADQKEVPAQSQSPGSVKLNIRYADIMGILGSLINRPEVPASLKMDTSFPIPSLKNAASQGVAEAAAGILEIPGSLPILQKPGMAFKGISVKNLGLQKLDFVVNWEVENKNNFSLDISRFVYDLAVNNASWAKGTMTNAPRLKANGVTAIPLDISISSLTMITQIADIINRGTGVNYKSTGSLNLAGDVPGMDALDLPFDLAGVTRLVR